MPVLDAECGICKTLTMPDGEKVIIKHHFPKALTHHYPLPPLDATDIPVYRGNFDHDGHRFRGVVVIDLKPTPRLHAHGVRDLDFSAIPEFLKGGGTKQPAKWVDLDSLSIPTKSIPSAAKTARPPKFTRQGGATSSAFKHLDGIDIGHPSVLDHLTFFVLNGWYGLDGFNTCYGGQERHGRVEVTLGGWQLRLEPRGDASPKTVRDHQRSTGASTVTHVGRIRRDNGDLFEAADALEILDITVDLIGFALGRVTAAVLPVGYRDSKPTWSRWQCNRAVDRPLGATPFLDVDRTAAQITELLRAGYATSQNSLRWQVFMNMLGYHFSAEHDATVKMKVLLPVSALQLISYAYLVEELPVADPNHLTNNQWRALDTVDQLRKILDIIGVDLAVPPHMANLTKVQTDLAKAEPSKTFDALACAVKLRNEVAHPKQKLAHRWTTTEWAETGFAATGMLHLAMLWWLGYDEKYMPKTAEYRGAGDSVDVPWHVP
ncbi:hypothetical protein ACFVWG_10655 [Kribbella sp. NPDC058245]|uniref:hypothetical protein n=1 Tax=Kribbella sp. NPDC058245 TaxID=3346399 RepID=UPI0036EDA825